MTSVKLTISRSINRLVYRHMIIVDARVNMKYEIKLDYRVYIHSKLH